MYGRSGLDRFKKSQSLEPFSVSADSASKTSATVQAASKGVARPFSQPEPSGPQTQFQNQHYVLRQQKTAPEAAPLLGQIQHVTQVGEGLSTWQPPDWAIEPRAGVYYLDVMKDGQILHRIHLDRRRHIFGRQHHACDFVLDHQSVSRQHAAVIPHKNGSIYVIDLGSAHGTFVANERLSKDTPVELEVGQSLRFAASTRTYILRKNNAALFSRPPPQSEINLPPFPDPSDEDAVVAYNTLVNRYGLTKPDLQPSFNGSSCSSGKEGDNQALERAAKRMKKLRVTFRDQTGGELAEVVGISDGADVETEPGPIGVKEGSLVGKYESLVQVTVIPKGKEQRRTNESNALPQTGVTDRLQEALKKVKSSPKAGIYDNLYGDSPSNTLGMPWAYTAATSISKPASPPKDAKEKVNNLSGGKIGGYDDDNDDLFGD